jgi:hypothetical protein
MKHKKQHYVPSSYLEAWCDADIPIGQEPFVWLISKDGTEAQKRAPFKLFHENDLYTIKSDSGVRDLIIEQNLSQLEAHFAKLRRDKLNKQLPLSDEERLVLCMFVSAMYGRTKVYGDYMKAQLDRVVDMGQHMIEWAKTATPEQLAQASMVSKASPRDGFSMTFDDIKQEASQPYPSILSTMVKQVAPTLMNWPMAIVETHSALGFLTSDNPCVWFDPELYKPNPTFGAGDLISRTLEITMPISPTQLVFFGKVLVASRMYFALNSPDMENTLNRRTLNYADKSFIVKKGAIMRSWFNVTAHTSSPLRRESLPPDRI